MITMTKDECDKILVKLWDLGHDVEGIGFPNVPDSWMPLMLCDCQIGPKNVDKAGRCPDARQ